MIELTDVKDKEEYYHKLNVGIAMSKMWNSLRAKSELGLEKSEMYYQLVSTVMAGNIARGLDLDADLAECLTMCQGSFFPIYGKAGKKIVMQYIEENGIEISEPNLAREFVEYDLNRTRNIISIDFDKNLQELFAVNDIATTAEVKLARFCGETIEYIKELEMNSTISQTDFVYITVRDIMRNCIKSGKLVGNESLQEHLNGITKKEYKLSDDKREEVYNRITSLSKLYKKGIMAGVYEFIGAR